MFVTLVCFSRLKEAYLCAYINIIFRSALLSHNIIQHLASLIGDEAIQF